MASSCSALHNTKTNSNRIRSPLRALRWTNLQLSLRKISECFECSTLKSNQILNFFLLFQSRSCWSPYSWLGSRFQTSIRHCLLLGRLCQKSKGHQLLEKSHSQSCQGVQRWLPVCYQFQRWFPTWIERIRIWLHRRETCRFGPW